MEEEESGNHKSDDKGTETGDGIAIHAIESLKEKQTQEDDEDGSTPVVDSEQQGKDVLDSTLCSEAIGEVGEEAIPSLRALDDEVGEAEWSDGISAVVTVLKETEPSVGYNDNDAVTEYSTLPVSDGNFGESSASAHMPSKESVDALLELEPAGAAVPAVKDDENCDMSTHVPTTIENQPFVGVTPRMRTSWMGCCGLFDVLRRSNQ